MPKLPPDLVDDFAAYVHGPGLVTRTLDAINPQTLNRPGPEGWTARDALVHLVDAELVASLRFRMILAEERPTLPVFDATQWKRRLHYLWRSPEAALSLFTQARFANGEILQQLSLSDWERAGVHPLEGEISLANLLRYYVAHTEEHALQIQTLRG